MSKENIVKPVRKCLPAHSLGLPMFLYHQRLEILDFVSSLKQGDGPEIERQFNVFMADFFMSELAFIIRKDYDDQFYVKAVGNMKLPKILKFSSPTLERSIKMVDEPLSKDDFLKEDLLCVQKLLYRPIVTLTSVYCSHISLFVVIMNGGISFQRTSLMPNLYLENNKAIKIGSDFTPKNRATLREFMRLLHPIVILDSEDKHVSEHVTLVSTIAEKIMHSLRTSSHWTKSVVKMTKDCLKVDSAGLYLSQKNKDIVLTTLASNEEGVDSEEVTTLNLSSSVGIFKKAFMGEEAIYKPQADALYTGLYPKEKFFSGNVFVTPIKLGRSLFGAFEIMSSRVIKETSLQDARAVANICSFGLFGDGEC